MLLRGSQISPVSIPGYIRQLSERYDSSSGQVAAWSETFRILNEITGTNRRFENVEFLFEYDIPFADGRRPDLLMFIRDGIYIIEFKRSYFHPPS